MKKIAWVIGLALLLVVNGYCGVKKATMEEVVSSIKKVEKAVKENNEDLISIYSSALEIEKRATTPYLAEQIMKKICKSSKISEKDFKKLREKHSFFDISIGWAVSQIIGTSLDEIMKEKENKSWDSILNSCFCGKNYCKKENIAPLIEKLNPKKKNE